MDDTFGLDEVGQAINELVLGNNYVTPCVQRAVCSAMAKVNVAEQPSSAEKIIDGISS